MIADDIQQRFGQRMRNLRHTLGLSQEDFALKCGLDRTYISSVERGQRNVCLKNIVVIVRALGVSPAEFFSGMDSVDAPK